MRRWGFGLLRRLRRSSGSRRVDLVEELVLDHLGHQSVDRLDGRLAAGTQEKVPF